MPRPPEALTLDRMSTPLGEGLLVTDADGCLRAFDWTTHETRLTTLLRRQNPPTDLVAGSAPAATRAALDAYFAGELSALDFITWRTGGTEFQRSVWSALCTIPAGETLTYKGLAERIGRPKAIRAVGLANGSNPVSIVVPCHRVIGADGTLTGYGGGLDRKHWLLSHEGAAFVDK
ncbi:MAG: methylated-DNA--protein-cysteine methyltransferase [Phenylobacterium sp.]|uniref:methylated-DNA--[protein]-cysteine S-methyltransferase n=1 Tax=Phenylobacterium sp. TaxID=1871053 RepID=UPI0025D08A33|nr:methylated-DNA--[protein]-cysteine S-methyltransferase [Phenylobacterium sp.]MBA4014016.1 methylated-DNA--protein-cysteine methyltransferase [Phenylobacterium sp.]